MDAVQYGKSKFKSEIKGWQMACDSLRKNGDNPVDITFEAFAKKKNAGITSLNALFEDLGIDPSIDTIENIFTLPDESVRWLIPEIFREALRLGLRKSPIWANVVAAEQTVKQLSITLPWFNMSDAAPKYVEQGETIPIGNLSFDKKTLHLRKIGRGVKIPYEVRNYVAINIVSIFLQDFGVKLGQAIDTLMIQTLINGEQSDGSESAPVIGIAVPNTLAYTDILAVWVRMSRIGRIPSIMIGGETAALGTLGLPEFKTNTLGGLSPAGVPTANNLKLRTAIPASTDYFIHAAMPANQQMVIDPNSAIVKYNAQPLLVEAEKIISNQTESTYATLTTGFGIIFRDSRVVIDSSQNISTAGFPSYMNVDAAEVVNIQ